MMLKLSKQYINTSGWSLSSKTKYQIVDHWRLQNFDGGLHDEILVQVATDWLRMTDIRRNENHNSRITDWVLTSHSSSSGARTSRHPGHFQVSTVVRQVISCELCEGPKVNISVSQGASQGRSFLAMAFDLARPGVTPPLYSTTRHVMSETVFPGNTQRLCDYLVNCAFEMSVY